MQRGKDSLPDWVTFLTWNPWTLSHYPLLAVLLGPEIHSEVLEDTLEKEDLRQEGDLLRYQER